MLKESQSSIITIKLVVTTLQIKHIIAFLPDLLHEIKIGTNALKLMFFIIISIKT